MRKYLLPLIITLFSLSAPLYAQDKPLLAVLDFSTGEGVSPGLKIPLALQLSKCLADSGKYRVLDPQNVENILKEQSFSLHDCATDECIIQVGKLLNTQRVVTGNVSLIDLKEFGKLYAVTAMISNISTNVLEAVGSAQCFCQEDELIGLMDKIANDLTGSAKKNFISIDGNILFAGKPILGVKNQEITVNLSNKSTRSVSIPPFEYAKDNGHYRIKNIEPGNYAIQITFDSRINNPDNYFKVCSGYRDNINATQSLSNIDIDFSCPIHLTKPIDSNIKTNFSRPFDCGNIYKFSNPVVISWEPVGKPEDNVYYEFHIIEGSCPGREFKSVHEGRTQKTQLSFTLPSNSNNQNYYFYINAFSGNQSKIGYLSVTSANGALSFRIK